MRLIDPLGERPLESADFPLTLGGAGSDVLLPGVAAGGVVARIGLSGDRLFIEPQGGATLRLDDRPIEASGWLDPGTQVDLGHGLLRVEARDGATALVIDYEAAPPAGAAGSRCGRVGRTRAHRSRGLPAALAPAGTETPRAPRPP